MSHPPPRPPQLVSETAVDKGEPETMVFRADEFDEFGQHFKRRLAAASKTDEISGHSTLLEIRAYFVVQRTLTEYSQEDA
jgi:hypothetical protein